MHELNLGGIPEKIKNIGVFVHHKETVVVGDLVEAICNVRSGEIVKGTVLKVEEIVIDPKPNIRGFSKRIKLEGLSGEYNPKRFKKVK